MQVSILAMLFPLSQFPIFPEEFPTSAFSAMFPGVLTRNPALMKKKEVLKMSILCILSLENKLLEGLEIVSKFHFYY